MNRKLRISLIILFTLALCIAIPLIILSFARIEIGYIALSYDNIIANYSSTQVYQPGMHFIGVARQFIRIRQIPTIVRIEAQTYTNDYFRLNSRIVVTYQIQNSKSFVDVDGFWVSYGDRAEEVIGAIVEKKIVSVLSQYSSTFYKSSFNSTDLQATIDTLLTNIFAYQLSTPLNIQVLIESLVVESAATSSQPIQKQISNTLIQMKRAQNEKIEISNLIKNIKQKSAQELAIALQIIKQRVQVLAGLYEQGSTIPTVLFGNQVVRGNLSFYGSELKLRPELYATNATVVF